MKKNLLNIEPVFEFHIAKQIREKYQLDESFFSLSGNVIFANFYQVRVFVQKVNEKRNPSDHISPGEVNGAGLLDEIYHIAIRNYIKNIFPDAFKNALTNLKNNLGNSNYDKLFLEFIDVFPPKKVYKNEITPKQYLEDSTDNISNREILLEELILLHLENRNPAFKKIKEFFDEDYFHDKLTYRNAISSIREFFSHNDLRVGITNSDMFDFLSRPFLQHGDSIWDQLEYIKNEWGIFIDQTLLMKIQSSKDLFIESIKFEPSFGGGGTPTIVPQYKGQQIAAEHLVIGKSNYKYAEDSTKDYEEFEQFTPDVNWMPNLILMAKNIYVWLDQLSKKYEREIRTLDRIPIEELQELKKRNINGLWLIGIWERSSASKRIKHMMGNIDAVASAYSLYDYQIANNLGGEYAYQMFNQNAKEAGIRLASDMVPNHTGIFSKWVIEKPDHFIQSSYPPFPNYRFTGENLSDHPDVELRIEDQYWTMKDAAVVFERKDIRNNDTRYLYHGNDGTSMPWNDTAQLNLMKAEVREELIQKIFEVARKFSVIRFDAAMTLAKKHYSRLWFPEHGMGGDIPSRADYAMTRRQFDELFPQEFWREVVDRINEEMPETLLLAEAFWLMEGYFVRTLGMHRVYNSAFMNMMMNEENQKYRELITNTLEFEPEILKRYVNFMSNPDEETAIEQFGDGDKYFGVLILMCTLPGLPMFAHGQIEGYKEKYGMEYQRAYYNETPTQWLVERHEKEIFPVLRKRYIFSEVKNYWLYDFLDQHGNVNENVFIYSNEFNGEKGIVIFNNKYESATGRFFYSRQKLNGNSTNTSMLRNVNIAEILGVRNSDFHFYILRDVTNGLEYLYNGSELHNNGIYLSLSGYEHRVILHTEEIFDPTGDTYRFYKENYGRGTYSIKKELNKIQLAPVHNAFRELFAKDFFENINLLLNATKFKNKKCNEIIVQTYNNFLNLIEKILGQKSTANEYKIIALNFSNDLRDSIKIQHDLIKKLKKNKLKSEIPLLDLLTHNTENILLTTILLKSIIDLGKLFDEDETLKRNYINDLMLTRPIKSVIRQNIVDEREVSSKILFIDALLNLDGKLFSTDKINNDFLKLRSGKKLFEYLLNENKQFFTALVKEDVFKTYLEVNTYNNKIYFSKERFEDLVDFLNHWFLFNYSKVVSEKLISVTKQKSELNRFAKKLSLMNVYLKKQSGSSKYLFNSLIKNLQINT